MSLHVTQLEVGHAPTLGVNVTLKTIAMLQVSTNVRKC